MDDQEFREKVMEALGSIQSRLNGLSENCRRDFADHREFDERTRLQDREIAALRVKTGFLGVLGGLVGGALTALLYRFKG